MKQRSSLDKIFKISLIVKALDGVFELIGAVLLLVLPTASISSLAEFLTQHELTQDPHDFIASSLLAAAHHLGTGSALFGSFYLAIHSVVKVVLVAAVLKNKLWAYPWMIGFLTIFTAYQLYRLTYRFSVGLLLLTIFDVLMIALTMLEYRRHQRASVAA